MLKGYRNALYFAFPTLATPEAMQYVENSSINGILSSTMLRATIGDVDFAALEKELLKYCYSTKN
jgi:hypothetical protein